MIGVAIIVGRHDLSRAVWVQRDGDGWGLRAGRPISMQAPAPAAGIGGIMWRPASDTLRSGKRGCL